MATFFPHSRRATFFATSLSITTYICCKKIVLYIIFVKMCLSQREGGSSEVGITRITPTLFYTPLPPIVFLFYVPTTKLEGFIYDQMMIITVEVKNINFI